MITGDGNCLYFAIIDQLDHLSPIAAAYTPGGHPQPRRLGHAKPPTSTRNETPAQLVAEATDQLVGAAREFCSMIRHEFQRATMSRVDETGVANAMEQLA